MRVVFDRCKAWLTAFLAMNAAIAVVLLLTNPYRLLPFVPDVRFLNDVKPMTYTHIGHMRFFDLSREQYDGLLLGSSRVAFGMDPSSHQLPEGSHAYNGALFGAQMFELKSVFEHALATQKDLKFVIIGVDLFAFGSHFDEKPQPLEALIGKSQTDFIRQFKSLAFADILGMMETVFASVSRWPTKYLDRQGMIRPDPFEEPSAYIGIFAPINLQPKQQENRPTMAAPAPAKTDENPSKNDTPKDDEAEGSKPFNILAQPNFIPGYRVSEKSLDALRWIVAESKKRGIDVKMYLSPTYTPNGTRFAWDTFNRLGTWPQILELRRRLAEIHPYWDFTLPGRYTEDPTLFLNAGHQHPKLGNLILAQIYGAGPTVVDPDFGYYVDAARVDAYLAHVDKTFKAWVQRHSVQKAEP